MGVDCSGLVQAVYAVHRIRLPRDSADQAHVHAGLRLKDGHPGDPKPGDLLFFAPEEKGVTHVAIVVDAHRIVHAAASRGCVKIDNLLEADPLAERLRNSIVGWTRPLATS
jgi:cell wall-associated NlpC family hydrolase